MDMCLERKNTGKMPPASPETISPRWPHPTGDLVLGLESSHPWGFLPEVLRIPLGHTQAVPQEAMLALTRAYPQSRGQGGGDLPALKPLPVSPTCILRVFHFSGFMLLFQRETCVFSVRFQ